MRPLILALFAILLAGSIYYCVERVLFCDASFIMFRIINVGWFQIQEYRYGSAITQAFPYVASKLGLPLSWIVVLYSASFNIFYLAVAAWLLKCREYAMAVLMSFFYVLLVSDTFFWSNNEIHQAIAWMFLFFSTTFLLAKRNTSLLIFIPVFSVLGFLTLFTHPLAALPFAFLWVFLMLQKNVWPYNRKQTILLSGILVLIVLARFWASLYYSHFAYDAERMKKAFDVSPGNIFGALSSPMAKEFVWRCVTNYWILVLVFGIGVYSGIRQKKYQQVGFTVLSALGYFTIMCFTFKEFVPYYSESEWASFTIIAAAPFVYFTLPGLKPKTATLLLAGIFFVRLTYIAVSADKFIQRKEWIYTTLETMKQKQVSKAIIPENETNRKILMSNWSQPSESMIASALNRDNPQLTFVVSNPDSITKRIPARNQIILDFETGNYDLLDQRYFNFDTSSNYQLLPSPDQNGSFDVGD
jgi:hypothetical protein